MTIRNEFVPIAILGLVLLALIALGVQGLPAPLSLLRLLLGLFFVLLVPGYTLQAALFPRAGDLDGLERLALSFGLSVAIVPPIALALDRLPWGIRLWPIVVAEALFITACSVVAWLRRQRLPPAERPAIAIGLDLRGWWMSQDRTSRILYAVLVGALLTAAISAAAIILLPKPSDYFTEFYALGPEGLAENYPRQALVGEPVTVTVGITNREGVAAEYRVEIWVGEHQVGASGPVRLEDGETWERDLDYALPEAGPDQRVDFLLFRDDDGEPYRSLQLWIDVVKEEP